MEHKGHIETERRFLVSMPDTEILSRAGGDKIEQIYIESEAGHVDRVRRRERGGAAVFTYTSKKRIGDISAEEDERVIDEGEFLRLSKRQEPGTSPVKKTRYVIPYRGHNFEIDVYPAWQNVAVMEVELADADEEVILPPDITVLKEVSGERRLSNHALSRHMPDEDEILKIILQ